MWVGTVRNLTVGPADRTGITATDRLSLEILDVVVEEVELVGR